MVLGYGGFLGLSSAEYRAELKERTDEALQKQEIAKLRGMMSSSFAMAAGIPLHTLELKDIAKPVVASTAGVAAGGVFLDSAGQVGSIEGVGQGSISTQLENPDATIHGFEKGLTERVSEILDNLLGAIPLPCVV